MYNENFEIFPAYFEKKKRILYRNPLIGGQ